MSAPNWYPTAPEPKRPDAAEHGKRVARIVFDRRGNHSEAHIDEAELAAIITVGITTYLMRGV